MIFTKARRKDKAVITIINVYAPTSELVKKDESEIDGIYTILGDLFKEFKRTIILLAGDLNAHREIRWRELFRQILKRTKE